MSTFRNDTEAIFHRNEALQREADELRRERDLLRQALEDLTKPRPPKALASSVPREPLESVPRNPLEHRIPVHPVHLDDRSFPIFAIAVILCAIILVSLAGTLV